MNLHEYEKENETTELKDELLSVQTPTTSAFISINLDNTFSEN